MSTVLSIHGLSKNFGKIQAVKSLDLEIEEGNVYGLLGPNGSGKSTTLGMLLGVVTASSGEFSWYGKGQSAEVRKKVGAILEAPSFMPYMSAVENLKVVCKIKDVDFSRIEICLEMVGLTERKDYPFKTFSLGMKQRLAIASAMLSDPGVLILDEPTNGLDPQGIAEIRKLIIEIAKSGKTIILASHLLDEVQKVCTHFTVLKRGKKIFSGSVEDALAETETVELAAPDQKALLNALEGYEGLENHKTEGDIVILKLKKEFQTVQLHQHLISKGIVLTHLTVKRKSLEKQFLDLLAQAND